MTKCMAKFPLANKIMKIKKCGKLPEIGQVSDLPNGSID